MKLAGPQGRLFYLVYLLPVLAGFFYILIVTSNYNLAVAEDGVGYVSISRNLIEGRGIVLETPDGDYYRTNHWPPAYPISLSLTSLVTGLDSLPASRYLGALLFALNILLTNILFNTLSRNRFLQLVLNLLIVAAPASQVHLMIASEPLFISFLLSGTIVLLRHSEDRARKRLVVSAVLFSLMTLTRYAGVGFFVGGVAVLAVDRGSVSQRIRTVLLFSGVYASLLLVWTLLTGSGRTLSYHPISTDHLAQLLRTLLRWISPSLTLLSPILWLFLSLVAVYGFSLLRGWSHRATPDDARARVSDGLAGLPQGFATAKVMSLLTLAGVYVLFLAVSISFFDFNIPLDNRLLAPMYPLILVAGLSGVDALQALTRRRGSTLGVLSWVIVLLLVGGIADSHIRGFYRFSSERFAQGFDITGREWLSSATLDEIRRRYLDVAVYTNAPAPVDLLLGKKSYYLPEKYDLVDQQVNERFEVEVEALKSAVDSGGVLAYFNLDEAPPNLLRRDEIETAFEGYATAFFDDGMLITR